MIIENNEKLKQVRKDLKELGYKIKTHQNSLGQFGEVLTVEDEPEYVLGSSNVFSKKHIENYEDCFDYFKQYTNNKGNIII